MVGCQGLTPVRSPGGWGACVIYFNLTEQGTVVLITLYQKAEQAHIQPSDIKKAL